jgi:hypothetical protein
MISFQDPLYKAIAASLIFGIVFALAFNLYMRDRISREEGFTELYFSDHAALPDVMEVGRAYNISFTFTNHELTPKTYVYEVDSGVDYFARSVVLDAGDSANIGLEMTPRGRDWVVNWRVNMLRMESVEYPVGFNVLSFNVSGIGQAVNVNLSVGDLPYTIFREYENRGGAASEYGFLNSTFDLRDGYPMAYTVAGAVQSISPKRPFTVKLYEAGAGIDDVLEVHFWYEVR